MRSTLALVAVSAAACTGLGAGWATTCATALAAASTTLAVQQGFAARRAARVLVETREMAEKVGGPPERAPRARVGPSDLERAADELRRLAGALVERAAAADARSARLRSELDAQGRFVAHLSHEIRTPLNGLLGVLGVLQETDLDDQQQEWTTVARQSGESLVAMLDDVLDLAKMEAGKLVLERTEFDRDELFENVAALFAPTAHARGVELLLAVDRDVPPRLVGDPMRLRQMLVNLVGNAVKFTTVGEIEIAARWSSGSGETFVLEFEVKDSGVGIAPDRLERLFMPFEQADAATPRRFGGSGLGLTIVKHIVDEMRGTVEVDSRPGVGTRFVVRVPLGVGVPQEVLPRRAAGLVLVVDGHPRRRDLLATVVRDLGAEAIAVADAAGVRAARQQIAARDEPLVVFADDAVAFDPKTLADLRARAGSRLFVVRPPRAALDAVADGFDDVLVRPLRRNLLAGILDGDAAPVERRAATWPGRTVLLVEDNVVNQRLMCALLARLGVRIIVAADGHEAVAAFTRYACDLVLMDVHMPGMDGIEATRAIRAGGDRGARVPILALTASAQEGDREACLDAGMSDYLSKPVRAAALREALAKWLPAGAAAHAGAGC